MNEDEYQRLRAFYNYQKRKPFYGMRIRENETKKAIFGRPDKRSGGDRND